MLFRVLGPIEAHAPGGVVVELGAKKPVTLLATLLLHANAWVSVDQLVEAVWWQRAVPTSATANVKTYVWQLRRALSTATERPRIESRHGEYRVRAGPGEVDLDQVENYAADARLALAGGDPATAVDHLTAALKLWRGRPFDGLAAEVAWPVIAGLDELRLQLRYDLAGAYVDLGRHHEAINVLLPLTVENPLREGSWARLILALHAAGRRTEALATYRRARSVIVAELGIEPGFELAAAHHTVLSGQTGAPAAESVRPGSSGCPDSPRDIPDFTSRLAEDIRLPALSRGSRTDGSETGACEAFCACPRRSGAGVPQDSDGNEHRAWLAPVVSDLSPWLQA